MKTKNCGCPSFGLFWRKGWRRILNIKDIKIYFKRIIFFIKHGYPEQADWETFSCFIDEMREVLTFYRFHRSGTPWFLGYDQPIEKWSEELDQKNEEKVNQILTKMLDLLDRMDENSDYYDRIDFESQWELQCKAKDEFFKLFSEYFYNFWD